jgi:hypothetical protein
MVQSLHFIAILVRHALPQWHRTRAAEAPKEEQGRRTMKKLTLLALVVAMASPAFPAKSVRQDTVDQLLLHARGKSDAKVAKQLFNLQVTQRVSSATYARWEAELPGRRSRQALVALADASAFLPLPPDEVLGIPALDRAAQDSLLSRTRDYVAKTIPTLPNFFATRDAIDFSDETEDVESMTLVNYHYQQLHPIGTSNEKVYFREGKEVVDSHSTKQVLFAGKALATQGIFGEALELILIDVLPSEPVWSHWEGTPNALAVFRYAVPLERSHYAVVVPGVPRASQTSDAYHGEMTIDPSNGTIVRLTLVAELSGDSQVSKGDVMVEYGPVAIGGINCTCPVKSASLTVQRPTTSGSRYKLKLNPDVTKRGVPQTKSNAVQGSYDSADDAPPVTKVSDARFRDYHQFRSDIRILIGNK